MSKKHQTYSNFKSGIVKNPYDKSLFGVGYLGIGDYKVRENGKITEHYQRWSGMIERCYVLPDKYPTYYGKCIVCEKWKCFQNFANWYENNRYECEGRLHVDKDILYPKSNIYSPETCLLVPQRINMLFMNKPNKRGLPNGITREGRKYGVKYNGEYLGTFTTIEEAYKVYSYTKECVVKKIADEYKYVIPQKVYDALYNYKMDINNDRNYIQETA